MNITRMMKLAMLLGLWVVAGSAHALTPGNTSLANVVTLTYTGNATGITSTSIVTVAVVASIPTLSQLPDAVRAENQAFGGLYTVTATNNGPDDYVLSVDTPLTTDNVLTPGTYVFRDENDVVITTVLDLGASAISVSEVADSNIIEVPSDGLDDNNVNGLELNDKVMIGAVVYVILAVDESGATTQITLDSDVPAVDIELGTGIYEVQEFYIYNPNVGTIDDLLDPPSEVEVTIFVDPELSAEALVKATDLFKVTIVNVTVEKFVRNVTVAGGGCTGDCDLVNEATFAGVDYYRANNAGTVVSATTLDVLEYYVRVTAPNAPLADAVVSDVLADFTVYQPSTTFMNTVAVADGVLPNPVFPLDPATTGTDIIPGMQIQDDNTTPVANAQGDGDVAAGEVVNIVYRVQLL